MNIKKASSYLLELIRFLRSSPFSLFFNFYYLPFKQAIKLPIWINKPHFHCLRGKIIIDTDKIKPGMIRLGYFGGHMYPNNGIHWTHRGTIVFKGKCMIGNNSFIVTGENGRIVFGNDFLVTTSFKLISFIGINFGKETRLGWDVLIMDTNFHPLYDMKNKKFKKAYEPIYIGDNNWIGTGVMVMPGVTTPKRCIFGAKTIVTRGGNYESYCIHGGVPIGILSRNIMRIIGKDKIDKYI